VSDSLTPSSRKKRKTTTTSRRKVELFESFKGQKLSDDAVESHIFGNLTFCEWMILGVPLT
jgi:hypothetical protein